MMLFRKIIRDLRQNFVQFLAIYVMTTLALLIAAGFNSSDIGIYNSFSEYLADTNYKDLDIQGREFYERDIRRLTNIDGVSHVDGLLHATGKTTLDKERLLAIGYIGSNNVSRMYLIEGEDYVPGSTGVWVEDIFAKAMGIRVGDTLKINTDGRMISQTVKGLVYYPEFFYYVPNETYTEPEYGTHGFVVMDISQAPYEDTHYDQLIIDLRDVVGQGKTLTAKEKAIMSEYRELIQRKMDEPGLLIKIKTEDDGYDESVGSLDQNNAFSTVFPMIFMTVALLGILTTMTRLTGKQRTQIGTLKALGFSRKTITIHYLSYSVIIAFLGCLTGIVIGPLTLGSYSNDMMDYYYQNPYIRLELSSRVVYLTLAAVILCAVVTYFCTRTLLVQNASEILRPEAPKSGGAGFIENSPIWDKLRFATRWNIRDVYKNKLRSVMSIMGILVCSMLLFTAVGFYECVDAAPSWMYGGIIQAGTKITFEDSAGLTEVYDYSREYAGQMILEEHTTLVCNGVDTVRQVTIVDNGNMYRVMDEDLNYMELPQYGAVLTSRLVDLFDVKEGDTVTVKFSGDSKSYEFPIVKICRQASGQGLVLSRNAFEAAGGTFAPNIIYTNKTVPKTIVSRKEIQAVNTVADLKQSLENINELAYTVCILMIVFAVVMGTVVLYNLGLLSYIEKVREIATLKVLGFQSISIRYILMQQNLTITAIGAILGIPAGLISLYTLADFYMGEDGDVIVRVTPLPVLVAVLGTFFVSVLVNKFISAKVNGIDMVEALKGVE